VAWDLFNEIYAEIHFQAGKTVLSHALLQAVCEDFRVIRFRGVCIAADLIPKFPAEHLIRRHVVDFAGDIPQRHLYATDATPLPGMAAKLFNFAEYFVDTTGILAEDDALQHQRVVLAGPVPNFSEAVHALVGVDSNNRAAHRRADYGGDTHVGDLEVGRL